MSKKILEITVRSDIGGGPKHLSDLLETLDGEDCEAYVAAPLYDEYSCKFKVNSMGIIGIPHRKFSLLSFIKLLSFCIKNKITTIHSHGRGAGVYSRLLKITGAKVIHTLHGVHVEAGILGKLKKLSDKLLMPLTDIYICVSHGEKREALKHGLCVNSKTVVIENGVKIANDWTRIDNEVFTLGSLSRLNHQKGLDLLITNIESFIRENQDANLKIKIAGGGELTSEINSLIIEKELTDYISLVGPTSKPDDFLKSLDAYISNARWEGMPLAVLEAMSLGLPVIGSDVVGNNDIISDGENGLLFAIEDVLSFNKKLKFLINDKENRVRISTNARSLIESRFSLDKMARLTFKLYR